MERSGYQHRKLVKSTVSGVRDGFTHGRHDLVLAGPLDKSFNLNVSHFKKVVVKMVPIP